MRFNSTILENLGNGKKVSGDIGIEIETELTSSISSDYVSKTMPNWSLKGDGSLRGYGFEFVTKGALKYADIDKNVQNWRDTLTKGKWKLLSSDRTSVHIHKNIQKFTVLDAVNSICCYWLLEPYLLDFCGESRKGNNFCLTLQDAGDIHTQLIKGIKTGKTFDNIEENSYRYSSLNLYAIQRFGSLEVRLMRGTDSAEEISRWAKALNQIFENGRNYKSPKEIINFLANKGPEEFLKSLLEKDFIHFFNKYSKNADYSKIEENALLINDIAEARKSWNFFVDEKRVKEAYDSLVKDKIKYLLLLGYVDDSSTSNTIGKIAKGLVDLEVKKNNLDVFSNDLTERNVAPRRATAVPIEADFAEEEEEEPEEPNVDDAIWWDEQLRTENT